ncbi:MAG: MerR family transcriptional regulator [Alphaproteobacteria bacterium]|nr:MerR family transcriptional regulator [Alphaproteobacteria bacterium]MBM3624363.1 MerR family transcriptional regulator [Alphaproteobacteria bacterium]
MRTIGEVAESLDLPAHVLRFWETRFRQINPLKRAGGRRFYRQRDIDLVIAIRCLLYEEGYTIRGVQRILKEDGVEAVLAGAGRRQGALQLGEPPLPRRSGGTGEPFDPEDDEIDEAYAEEDDALQYPELDMGIEEPAPLVEIDRPFADASAKGGARALADSQARVLREVLAEIEECKRLLKLTKR